MSKDEALQAQVDFMRHRIASAKVFIAGGYIDTALDVLAQAEVPPPAPKPQAGGKDAV